MNMGIYDELVYMTREIVYMYMYYDEQNGIRKQ